MKIISKAQIAALELLKEIGMEEITDFPMDLLVSGLDAVYMEEPMAHCDGKIIFGKLQTLIKVSSNIEFPERKRYVTAHEIGHLRLHKNMKLPEDGFKTLSVILAGTEHFLQSGVQELEANQFAAELLMPTSLFTKAAKGKPFSPVLLSEIASRFKTSLTSTALRYLEFPFHPICVVFIQNGLVRFWRKSEGMQVWIPDITKLPPPTGSVAAEYIANDYNLLYGGDEKAQTIKKSVWFDLGRYGEDDDIYEYCIPTKKYKSIISLIWER